jgi:hypothetical protein
MTDRTTLLALAERCEQAAGPDRELDFAIFRAADPDFHGWHRWALREAALYRDGWQEGCGRKKLGPILLRNRKDYAVSLYNRYAEDKTPHYAASVDAAVTLYPTLPEVIPSCPRKASAAALRARAAMAA